MIQYLVVTLDEMKTNHIRSFLRISNQFYLKLTYDSFVVILKYFLGICFILEILCHLANFYKYNFNQKNLYFHFFHIFKSFLVNLAHFNLLINLYLNLSMIFLRYLHHFAKKEFKKMHYVTWKDRMNYYYFQKLLSNFWN